MSKNSPKKFVDRLPSDGGLSPFNTSPDIRGSEGGAAATDSDTHTLAFALDGVVLSLLAKLKPGQAVEFNPESETSIVATQNGNTIGYVPRNYRQVIKEMIGRGSYMAVIEDVSHESVRVRVTE